MTVVSRARAVQTCAPQSAFEQALRIHHQVVLLGFQTLARLLNGLPGAGLTPRSLPTPHGHRDHMPHSWVPGGNGGERLLHQPVDFYVWLRLQCITDGGQHVNHIAQ